MIFYQYNFAMCDMKHANYLCVMLQIQNSRQEYNSATDPYIMICGITSQSKNKSKTTMGGNATAIAPADSYARAATVMLPLRKQRQQQWQHRGSIGSSSSSTSSSSSSSTSFWPCHLSIHGIRHQIFMRRWKFSCCYSCRFLTTASSDLPLLC